MNRRTSSHIALLGLLLLTSGCSMAPWQPAARLMEAPAGYYAPGDPQIIAMVPQRLAPTAAAARAAAMDRLTRAKHAAERELCQKRWVFSGHIREYESPHAVVVGAPGTHRAWRLRLGWQPDTTVCGLSRDHYLVQLSRHLPAWMMLQGASPLAFYHQGRRRSWKPDAPAAPVVALAP